MTTALDNLAVREPNGLIKEHLARALKEAILEGKLVSGQRVVEGTWGRHFGVAQASVREAINILIAEGYLTKSSGRSARVIRYREEDVTELYQVRAALEGLATELATARKADVTPLENAVSAMRVAIEQHDMRSLIDGDLAFHLALCDLSANRYLVDAARRVLAPLFAFVMLQVLQSGQGPEAWIVDLPRHDRIIDLIREGEPALAGQYVRSSIQRFVTSAYAVWENVGGSVEAHAQGKRRQRGRKPKSGA